MADDHGSRQTVTKAPRRFAIEPVETSTKSNRGDNQLGESPAKAPRRFAVQPIETSSKSSRKAEDKPPSLTKGVVTARESSPAEGPKPRRKFAPQLLETTTRTRKRGDTVPALRELTDKTDLSPGDYVHLPRHVRLERSRQERPSPLPLAPENTPVASSTEVPTLNESRFSAANLAKKLPRRTSIQAPRLEPIHSLPESDESTQSNVPSLSTTPSADSEPIDVSKHPSRLRESMDDRFSGYLLALAARVAEQQLKEQAMAAYPNETMHEPVDHFAVNHDSDETSDEEMGVGMLSRDEEAHNEHDRRESSAGWDLQEMQKHRAKLEKQRQEHVAAEKQVESQHRSPPAQKQFPKAFGALPDIPKNTIGGGIQNPSELKKMRSAASPPMLGKDLIFPSCPSPKYTMMDPTQRPRKHEYDIEQPVSREASGLWTPVSVGSAANSPDISRKHSATGLWHGVCTAENGPDSLMPPQMLQSGLMTPALQTPSTEAPDPFANFGANGGAMWGQSPRQPAPGASANDNSNGLAVPGCAKYAQVSLNSTSIDSSLSLDSTLDQEFPDTFVTQVYNYLSLGYPALARQFDHELSKISRISVAEIRREDARRNTKGFVGAPEGEGCAEDKIKEACGRWRALRLYVREWGRQEGRMIKGNGTWGQAVRRGSWAI